MRLLDTDGENLAVRWFLSAYGYRSLSVKEMKIHLKNCGFDDCWPAWANGPAKDGPLTKGVAQDWLRYLFALEAKERES